MSPNWVLKKASTSPNLLACSCHLRSHAQLLNPRPPFVFPLIYSPYYDFDFYLKRWSKSLYHFANGLKIIWQRGRGISKAISYIWVVLNPFFFFKSESYIVLSMVSFSSFLPLPALGHASIFDSFSRLKQLLRFCPRQLLLYSIVLGARIRRNG